MPDSPASDSTPSALVERALARLAERAPQALADPARHAALARLALCSDFAIDTLCRQPELLDTLDGASAPLRLEPDQEADWPARLRRWRTAESTRLVWRDLRGIDDVDATLAGSSRIADEA